MLAAGILLRTYPRLLWNLQNTESERNYVPQLLVGLFFLVGLLSSYVLEQRRRLKKTKEFAIQELIRRETAERLAVVDPLTELYNRRYIMQAINREARRADRQDQRFSLLMIDINDFKEVNDSLGHLVGGRIPREVAVLLQHNFRTTDIVSRYGGDEFLILLVDAEEKEAARAIERLRYQVEQWNRAESIQGYRMSLVVARPSTVKAPTLSKSSPLPIAPCTKTKTALVAIHRPQQPALRLSSTKPLTSSSELLVTGY